MYGNMQEIMKFLVIDDNKNFSYLLKEFLKIKGHKCVIVHDCINGISLAKDQDFNAILIDPSVCSGNNLINEMHKLDLIKNNKIVILTEKSFSTEQVKYLFEIGIKKYFRKPEQPDVILAALESIPRGKEKHGVTIRERLF
jgi:DNA-binding response OmpR family regulator